MARLIAAGLLLALAGLTVCTQQSRDTKRQRDALEKSNTPDNGPSNNTEKIIGKWRLTELPKGTPGERVGSFDGGLTYRYIEFDEEGLFTIGVGEHRPGIIALIDKKLGGDGEGPPAYGGKYWLLAGDGIELYDIPKEL